MAHGRCTGTNLNKLRLSVVHIHIVPAYVSVAMKYVDDDLSTQGPLNAKQSKKFSPSITIIPVTTKITCKLSMMMYSELTPTLLPQACKLSAII